MDESMETFVPLTFRRRGVQRVATDERSVHDVTLLDGVTRAFYWQHLLDTLRWASASCCAASCRRPGWRNVRRWWQARNDCQVAPSCRRRAVFCAFRCLGRALPTKRRSKPMVSKPAPIHDFGP